MNDGNSIGSSELCVKEKPVVDETTWFDRIFGNQDKRYESTLIGQNSDNATNVDVIERSHKSDFGGAKVYSGSVELHFDLDNNSYKVESAWSPKITKGTNEAIPFGTEEYLKINNVYQSLYKQFRHSPKCSD